VLAGDIDLGAAGVQWALDTFRKPVVYVLGNHEPYGTNVDSLLDEMRALARDTHVHVLENESCLIDVTQFIGATFWTDFSLADDPTALRKKHWQRGPVAKW
jgi:predicted MPP superfamily phosphohydrolase